MANGDITQDDPTQGDSGGGGGPQAPQPSAPQGGPPGGGGPMLAAMARNQMGPQVSAPGPGNMADSMTQIQAAVGMIQQAAIGLPPGSPLHRDALQAAQRLSRHLGQAGVGAGAGLQKTMLGDMFRRTIQQMLLQRIQAQRGQAQPGQADDQSPAGQGPPGMAPMPSTPMPGA